MQDTAYVKSSKGWMYCEDSRVSKAQDRDVVVSRCSGLAWAPRDRRNAPRSGRFGPARECALTGVSVTARLYPVSRVLQLECRGADSQVLQANASVRWREGIACLRPSKLKIARGRGGTMGSASPADGGWTGCILLCYYLHGLLVLLGHAVKGGPIEGSQPYQAKTLHGLILDLSLLAG